MLLLTICSLEAFEPVRRRISRLWETVWHESGDPSPAPRIVESRTEITGPGEAERFIATVTRWLPL